MNILKSGFETCRAFLDKSWDWKPDMVAEYQNQMLVKLVGYCYKNIPYYTRLFNEHGILPENIKDNRDMKRIPYLNREKAALYKDELKPVKRGPALITAKTACTGGTSSAPLCFERTLSALAWEKAFYRRMWSWHGFENARCLILRGNHGMDKGFYSYNPITKYITVNIKGVNNELFEKVAALIEKFRPEFLQAYPSIAWLFAQYINNNSISGNKAICFKKIFCSSEKLFNFQVNEIEKAFNCKVVDAYGHNEMVVLLQKCSFNDNYHIIPEYGLAEFIDLQGKAVSKGTQVVELLGSGFYNKAFPLLNYRTGDLLTVEFEGQRCKCGKAGPRIREIHGREGDFVRTRDGKLYSPTILEYAVDSVENIIDLQLIQKDLDSLDILIVPAERFAFANALKLKYELLKIINTNKNTNKNTNTKTDININIHIVEEIKRPSNLKKRFVLSEIAEKEQQHAATDSNK